MSASTSSSATCSRSSVTVHVCDSRAEVSAPWPDHPAVGGQSARHEAHRFTPVDRTPVAGPTTADAAPTPGPDQPVPWNGGGTRPDLPEYLRLRPGTRLAVAADRVDGAVRALVALAHRFPDRGRRLAAGVGALRYGQPAASLPDADP